MQIDLIERTAASAALTGVLMVFEASLSQLEAEAVRSFTPATA